MTYVFIFLAALAFVGFFLSGARRDDRGMAYALVVCALWILAALWWSGRIS